MNNEILNIEKCSGIIWWKKKRRKVYLRNSISFAFFAGVFGFFFLSVIEAMTAKDLVLIIGLLCAFAFIAIKEFINYLTFPSAHIEKYWYGQIIGTRRRTNSRKKGKAYYIIADIRGKELEGRCLYETYLRAETGDEVVVFSVEKKGMYCVHRDMP